MKKYIGINGEDVELNECTAKKIIEIEIRSTIPVQKYILQHLLDNGTQFTPKPRPKKIRKMQDSMCWKNSINLCFSYQNLNYCEGRAVSPATGWSTWHGWCVDDENNVIDPTWDPVGYSYFGVVVPKGKLRDFILREGKNLYDGPLRMMLLEEYRPSSNN